MDAIIVLLTVQAENVARSVGFGAGAFIGLVEIRPTQVPQPGILAPLSYPLRQPAKTSCRVRDHDRSRAPVLEMLHCSQDRARKQLPVTRPEPARSLPVRPAKRPFVKNVILARLDSSESGRACRRSTSHTSSCRDPKDRRLPDRASSGRPLSIATALPSVIN